MAYFSLFSRIERLKRALTSRERSLWIWVLLSGMVAQYLVDKRRLLGLGFGLYGLAAVFFVAFLGRKAIEAGPNAIPGQERRFHWEVLLLSLGMGALAFSQFQGNVFRGPAVILWGIGLALLGFVAWQPPKTVSKEGKRVFTAEGLLLRWRHVVLLVFMAIGAFYRLYRIGSVPLEMGCDLPHIYNNIRLILRKEFLIFFPSYPGREGLFFYLAAPLCRLFGLSHLTIKISSALIGVMTLPVFYLLGKELFNAEVGLYAAFFLAVSHWHVILTRVGYRACTLPLVLALMWYFLLRAFKTGRRWFYAWAGFFLGLGFYTYNAFMIAPLLVLAFLVGEIVLGRGKMLFHHWQGLLLLAITALFVFIPLGRYALEEPSTYFFRAATRITSIERSLPRDILRTLLDNLRKAFLMFNYRGDAVFIANVPGLRELSFFGAIFFVFGVAYLLWRWRQGYNLSVLLGLVIMLLPTALALAFPQEVPNAIRAIGALPAALMIPAVALALLRRRLAELFPSEEQKERALVFFVGGERRWLWRWHWWPTSRHLWILAFALFFVWEVRALYPIYFDRYVAHLPDHNYSISLAMARVIDDFADDGEAYIKVMPYWYDGNAVRAQLRRADQSWHNELSELSLDRPPFVGPPGKFVVILHPQDVQSLQLLRQAFPRGIVLTHRDDQGKVAFLTFYGER
ncbi:MAG: glycosyltransferase family 39 protein [Anaerolineae bacterium]|nr:glycosyltransferase family 39 protein [Anaerolineae bacterium]